MIIVGVDSNDNIWLLDCVWQRLNSLRAVDEWLRLIREWNPITWWAEDGQISKSIEPFLRKRMLKEGVFCTIDKVTVPTDKKTRAQSIKAYMQLGKVLFPRNAPWFQPAKKQLLKFLGGSRFDDFVDAMSLFGLKLTMMTRGKGHSGDFRPDNYEKTFGAFKEHVNQEARDAAVIKLAGGF